MQVLLMCPGEMRSLANRCVSLLLLRPGLSWWDVTRRVAKTACLPHGLVINSLLILYSRDVKKTEPPFTMLTKGQLKRLRAFQYLITSQRLSTTHLCLERRTRNLP